MGIYSFGAIIFFTTKYFILQRAERADWDVDVDVLAWLVCDVICDVKWTHIQNSKYYLVILDKFNQNLKSTGSGDYLVLVLVPGTISNTGTTAQ